MERIHRELQIFFSRSRLKNFKTWQKFKLSDYEKIVTRDTPPPPPPPPLMIVIICAKYKKNPSRTVDATERTRFSKSRPNDLEDIGQGQGSSHMTHPLMLLIICTKYGKNPSWTVDATELTRDAGRTDGRTDGRTNGRSETNIPPNNCVVWGYNKDDDNDKWWSWDENDNNSSNNNSSSNSNNNDGNT